MAQNNASNASSSSSGAYAIRAVLDTQVPELSSRNLGIVSARRVMIDAASRSASPAAEKLKVGNDELVRVVFEGGQQLWLRADELRALRERSAAADRGTRMPGDEDLVELDLDSPGTAERGVLSVGIKVLEFFGVDLKQSTAGLLAGVVDRKRLLMGREALFRCDLQSPQAPLLALDAPLAAPSRPLLIFIHGTFSHFKAAYGGLVDPRSDEGARPAAELRQALVKRYGDGIFAFEHQTLTRSPIENAQNLVDALPDGAQLHLVSHSRGGLVGELLALAQLDKSAERLEALIVQLFEAEDPQRLRPAGLPPLAPAEAKALKEAYAADAKRLRQLVQSLAAKRITVTRFVRVACPARGTTLASARLDRWLGLLHSVVPDSFVGDALDFLLAVLKERTDARVMPGVEAMMPGSALTRLLNAGLVTGADLSVIAGDTQGSGLFNRLKSFVADWFYGADNDLVVNTGSMNGGLLRLEGRARALEDRGPQVSHSRYFLNPGSLAWLQQGLLRQDHETGAFADIRQARQEQPRARSALARSAADTRARPIVVFLPGAMGSALQVSGEPVWLAYLKLLGGGIELLDPRADLPKGAVVATEPLEGFYGPLIDHLSRSFRVEAVPYDWRLSLRDNAQALRPRLEACLQRAESEGVAVHVVAHSMGGLVARCLFADAANGGSQLWERLGALKAGPGRLLMLGTPNQGSMEAVRWLTGHNPSQAKLAFLDFTRGVNGLMEIVRHFPGLVQLLPFGTVEQEQASCDPKVWAERGKLCGVDFPLVEPALLQQAREVWKLLREAPVDKARMRYVAGSASATVIGSEVVTDEHTGFRSLGWLATREGDGTVSWESGRLPEVPTWYAPDTAHDELCNNEDDPRIFAAYVELINTGHTQKLPDAPPARQRGERTSFKLVQPPADAMPSEDELRQLGLGQARRRRRAAAPTRQRSLRLSVRHGDLRVAARHPVVVGHYQGDLLVSAERALDKALNQALQKALRLGIYPGRSDTRMSFFADAVPDGRATRGVQGALVIGLGQVGELTAGRLRAAARDAMLDHARQCLQRPGARSAQGGIGLSCLLVGSAGAGLSVRESLEALLRGALDANLKLGEAELQDRVLIEELEFVELFEDVAVATGHALHELRLADDLAAATEWDPAEVDIATALGGRRRSVFDSDRGWDLRVEILEDETAGQLRYSTAGQRARAEQAINTGQVALVENFIEEAIGSTDNNEEIGKTLYEMLLPVDFRLAAPDSRGLVLLLDERSARFPWELLEDRWGPNRRPLAVETALVRQLKTVEYRGAPRMAAENAVLVIGDPQLSGWGAFEQLPGAEEEARQVARIFEEELGAPAVHALLGATQASTRAITGALHLRPWRVMHLAAHGVHRWKENDEQPERSGMIIGKRVFLQPGDFEQLRHVPELVFINCCELGRTTVANPQTNRLAANVAVALIRMGVRAVIASGWAVDDEAGVTFAQTFYRRLLGGANFRDAVHEARQETYRRHPQRNTWGAYQCYGEPGWRLVINQGGGSGGSAPRYVSPRELVVDVDNLRAGLYNGEQREKLDEDRRKRLLADVQARCARVPPGPAGEAWLRRGDVAGAIGQLYVEAELSDEAQAWLKTAVSAGDDQAPLAALEQLANRRVRQVEKEWRRIDEADASAKADTAKAKAVATEEKRQSLREELASATRLLAELAPNSHKRETWALLGSAHKRRALLSRDDPAGRSQALFDMAQAYKKAQECAGGDDYYPVSNGFAGALLLGHEEGVWSGTDREAIQAWRPDAIQQLRALQQADQERLAATHETWRAVGQGDLLVTRLLAEAEDAERVRDLREQAETKYRHAFDRAGTQRNVQSARLHLMFLRDLMAAATHPWSSASRDAIDALIKAADLWDKPAT
ncbi:MAG: CHAT domain-containing protein [Rubrivivax sp.]|nr:CHAT domain-containing protein [Rubrivivax sp.]